MGVMSPLLRSRRRFLVDAAALAALSPLTARAERPPIRIGLTPVFLDDQINFLTRWRIWLEERLGRTVIFVQRGNYREIVDLVLGGKLDFAWICGYPYVRHRNELTLAAVPLWQGKPLYQSYLIVPASDTRSKSLLDLRGKIFAYSDPDSNSGYLYPRYSLTMRGENSANFFSRTFFTWAHRKVVEVVGVGLADGGAVDGYVWEALAISHPQLTSATRIIERSPLLGHPPIVARPGIPPRELERFREALVTMAQDVRGAELLKELHLDGFVEASPSLYDDIARMAKAVKGL
jgi:phosphonate transport system substrate-binding protein